jgi:phosphatidyl-N-methylethanolamine N-methyltransferase
MISIIIKTINLSHLLYAFVWLYPVYYKKVGKYINPINLLINLSILLKCIQILLCSYYVVFDDNYYINSIISRIIGTCMIMFGQILNIMVYQKLGNIGVYYGNKLGHTTPWITSFPYNVIKHPQYIGCCLTLWGLYLIIPTYNMLRISIYWSLMYLGTVYIETY